mmetsp:Transcript_61269/g.97266  ORF Transcript_61269/g.97266 Transcript_61269/m.97266 type:complete len:206 (+) Transcript_61269:277-894(+)
MTIQRITRPLLFELRSPRCWTALRQPVEHTVKTQTGLTLQLKAILTACTTYFCNILLSKGNSPPSHRICRARKTRTTTNFAQTTNRRCFLADQSIFVHGRAEKVSKSVATLALHHTRKGIITRKGIQFLNLSIKFLWFSVWRSGDIPENFNAFHNIFCTYLNLLFLIHIRYGYACNLTFNTDRTAITIWHSCNIEAVGFLVRCQA